MVKSAFGEVIASPGTTFRTVTRRETKIVYNKAVVDALYAGIADGVIELLGQIRDDAAAHAPRDPEAARTRGEPMLKDTGRIAVYAMGKLVSGTGERAAGENKPRGAKTPADQVVGFVMFDSWVAHFAELGTVKEVARPFLIPAFSRAVGGTGSVVLRAMRERARKIFR